MDVVILLIFISLVLVAGGLVFFAYRLRAGDFDHAERLALAPLKEDTTAPAATGAGSRENEETPENQEGGTLNDGS